MGDKKNLEMNEDMLNEVIGGVGATSATLRKVNGSAGVSKSKASGAVGDGKTVKTSSLVQQAEKVGGTLSSRNETIA